MKTQPLFTLLLLAIMALVSCNGNNNAGITPEESKECNKKYSDCNNNCYEEANERNKEINDCYKNCAQELSEALLECPCGEEGDQCREDARNNYNECVKGCEQKREDSNQKTKECNDKCTNEYDKCIEDAKNN